MPLSHETVMFDVHDCKVAPLLTDNFGEAPTYGPLVDVPGISEVGLDPNFVTAELKGDARVIAKKGRIDRFNFSGTYSKLALDVLGVIIGADVQDQAAGTASTVNGDTTSGENTVTGTGYTPANLVGRSVSGAGIPTGTYIVAATTTQITLNNDATATATGVSLDLAATAEAVRVRMSSPAPLPYFKTAFKIEDLDQGLGDLHVICYKCQITGGTLLGSSSDNFGQPSFDAEAIAIDGTLPGANGEGCMVDWTLLATKTPLS